MGNKLELQQTSKNLFGIIGTFAKYLEGVNNSQSQPKIIQKTDPKILQELEQLKKLFIQSKQDIQRARKEAIKASNPQLYKEKKENIFVTFLDNLKQYKFTDKIVKNGRKTHMIIGPISVGKSFLLNSFLGLKLKTGVGETTDKATIVASNGQVDILDSPGANDDFNFYDINVLALFYCVDRVFLLYRTSLKDVKDILRIMKVIKPDDTYLIRTQCDNFSQNDFKSLDQQLMTDKQYVEEVLGVSFPIFATSAKRDEDFADNQQVAKLIKGMQ